ncbi:MAG: GNAT family N-acetyltransferase [Nitrososphaerales archaeon]
MSSDVSVVVRPASLDDIDVLLKIERECFEHPYDRSIFESILCASSCQVLFAGLFGSAVGYIAFNKQGRVGTILSVAVLERFRRRGVGRYLMRQAISRLREAGVRRIVLQVSVKNVAARRLYESMRFRAEMLLRGYYRGEEDAILYSLHLPIH